MYGKTIASAEAFTDARYDQPLAYLKQTADAAYGLGVNEFVVCASAAQPWLDRTPGNTASGRQYCLNRNNTYWPMSRPFWDYQSRCAFMLRQGQPVCDLALYLGDDAPTRIIANSLPDLPCGFDFDACTTDALTTRMTVRDGDIILPDGVRYQAIVVKSDATLTPRAEHQLRALQVSGAKIWRDNDTMEFATFAQTAGIMPDLLVPQDRRTFFAHRRTEAADIYFVDNHEDSAVDSDYGFRAEGDFVEVWDAVTGLRYRAPFTVRDGYTHVRLNLAARESLFVLICRGKSNKHLPLYRADNLQECSVVSGPWQMHFGTLETEADSLTDWTESKDERIRYYSGTALCSNTFTASPQKGLRYFLSFETLHDMARVTVNGQEAGIVWCSPYRIDITDCLRKGENSLQIEVANSLYNRMIGDAMLPESERSTWATTPIVDASSPLVPSGVVGRVTILQTSSKN